MVRCSRVLDWMNVDETNQPMRFVLNGKGEQDLSTRSKLLSVCGRIRIGLTVYSLTRYEITRTDLDRIPFEPGQILTV